MNKVSLNKPHHQIGRILRVYREKTGRHQAGVAAEAGISTSMLSQIERGAVSPSIDTLVDVCGALGVEMAELFGRLSDGTTVRIHRQGNRLSTRRQGVRYERLVASHDSVHPAEMFLIEVEPGRQVGISGRGHEGIEMGYVFSGSALIAVDETQHAIGAGDSVAFSSHLPHRLVNRGGEVFRAVWTVLPPHTDYLDVTDGELGEDTDG